MKQLAIIGKGSSITEHLDFIDGIQLEKMVINDMIFRIKGKYCIFWDFPNWIKLQGANKIDAFGITIREHFTDEIVKHFNGFKVYIHKDKQINYQEQMVPSFNLSGIFALSVAALMGYDMVYLLGLDGGNQNGKRYSYSQTTILDGQARYDVFNKYYKQLNLNGMDVVNVGLDSKIDAFTKIDFKEFRNIIK